MISVSEGERKNIAELDLFSIQFVTFNSR